MKTLLLLLFILLCPIGVFSQDNSFYANLKEGTVIEKKTYNKRNRHLTTTTTTISKIEKTALSTLVTIDIMIKDIRSDSSVRTTHTIRCEDGKFYMNLTEYEGNNSLMTYKDEPIAVQSGSEQIHSGNTGKISLKVGNNYETSIEIKMFNVKVIGFETIKTDAGAYNCYKITYDLDTRVMLCRKQNKIIEWYNKEMGVIRRESYKSNGKLIEYTILTNIKEPNNYELHLKK